MTSSDHCWIKVTGSVPGAWWHTTAYNNTQRRTEEHLPACTQTHTDSHVHTPAVCFYLSNCHTHMQLLPTPTRLHCLTASSPLSPLSSTGLHYQTHVLAHGASLCYFEKAEVKCGRLSAASEPLMHRLFLKQCKQWCKGWVGGACVCVCVQRRAGYQAAATGTNSHSQRSKTLWDIRKTVWIMRRRLRENKAAAAQITIDSWTRVFVSYSSFMQDQRNNQPWEYLMFLWPVWSSVSPDEQVSKVG